LIADLLGAFGLLTILLRALILGCQTITIGGIVFLLFVARDNSLRQDSWVTPAAKLVRWSSLGLALAQLFFVITNTLVLAGTADIPIRDALGANFVLAGILAMVAGVVLFLWPGQLRTTPTPLWLIPALVMLAASVMTSHSASRMEDRALLISITTLHYLTTAAWIGGLPYLLIVMRRASDAGITARISARFSRLAQASVALLFTAGLGLSYWYLGSWNAFYGTSYGIMVMTKVIFFGCLVLLGAANFFLVRALSRQQADPDAKLSLIRFGEVEIGIGLTIILAAASLTSQPPGVDLVQDRVTLHDIARRYEPRMPRLESPNVKELSESSNEIRRRAKIEGRKLPSAFVPGASGLGVNTPADIAWSEYNHNWAGLMVLAIGILALLSRSKYFRWAKMWPLVFFGLAIFLFLRSDPENWPLGPNGFWESWAVPDVMQHRLAVLMIIAFGIFQFRVETNRVKSHIAALVFPAVCALGGVVLLTHTHGLSNVKEQLLVEMSHTPLAIFAVIAGWSRWLELRLPQSNPQRRYLAWVWPVCFIMIGLVLMDYHEADNFKLVRNFSDSNVSTQIAVSREAQVPGFDAPHLVANR
jgi:putative copper resistance protein D